MTDRPDLRRPSALRPLAPRLLVGELAERVLLQAQGRSRVAVDGAPAADPAALADDLAEALRERGRAVLRVTAADFLRPASVRLEHGRTDADSYYERWLDLGAVNREVLRPAGPGGTGRVLPRLWNAATDRSYRAEHVGMPGSGVLLLDGPLLLGRGLEVDLAVHLALSPGALRRRTPQPLRWTLPAFDRYRREVDPERVADLVVRWDAPDHPAVSWRSAARPEAAGG
jgi:hypothetical protein